MSYERRVIPVPTEETVTVCDGCRSDIEDEDESRLLRLSTGSDFERALHFCPTCRTEVLSALIVAFPKSSEQLKAAK